MKSSVFLALAAATVAMAVMAGAARAQEPVCSRPDVVFCSGFEEGSKAVWDDYDGNPDTENQIIDDPGPLGDPANHVMRFRVPPGRGGSDLVKVLPASYDKLYARWYQQWEPGYDFSARNHGSGLHAGSRDLLGVSGIRPNGDDRFFTGFEPNSGTTEPAGRMNFYSYYRGMYQDCVDPNGQCWGDHFPCMFDEGFICEKPEHRETLLPPVMEAGRWYCLEIMLDGGPAAPSDAEARGVQDFWIDGMEYGPWGGLWHRTTDTLQITILWLQLFHHEDHSAAGILLDNVVVARERIGCAAGTLYRGTVIDLSAPWKPAALPLGAGNDDEIAPFPAALGVPGVVTDPLPAAGPLILYHLVAPPSAQNEPRLDVVKNGSLVDIHAR